MWLVCNDFESIKVTAILIVERVLSYQSKSIGKISDEEVFKHLH